MKFIISGKNIEVTEALKERVELKIGKLNKLFNVGTEVHVTLSVEKNRQIVEVTIMYKGFIFRAEQVNEDMYASIDKVVDVLEKQIVKNKKRLEKRFKDESLKFDYLIETYGESIDEEHNVIKNKKFALKPMTEEEAILQMNLLGHEFYMFRNSENEDINVIYKRKHGGYGLIQPE